MQKDIWDCGVACLQMLLGKSYTDVRACIRQRHPDGLSLRQMKNIAARLGHKMTYRTRVEDDDIGILHVQRPVVPGARRQDGHCVVYVRDTVYNPAQGQWWMDLDAYLKSTRYSVSGILVLREEP